MIQTSRPYTANPGLPCLSCKATRQACAHVALRGVLCLLLLGTCKNVLLPDSRLHVCVAYRTRLKQIPDTLKKRELAQSLPQGARHSCPWHPEPPSCPQPHTPRGSASTSPVPPEGLRAPPSPGHPSPAAPPDFRVRPSLGLDNFSFASLPGKRLLGL